MLICGPGQASTYTLTYIAGTNGTISGISPQTVNYGASGTAVMAVTNIGYVFMNWSDGLMVNPRTDVNATQQYHGDGEFCGVAAAGVDTACDYECGHGGGQDLVQADRPRNSERDVYADGGDEFAADVDPAADQHGGW